MGKWFYQEWYLRWTMWGLGWAYRSGRGWDMDELTIFVGPLRLDFLRES
jgi:hypothetical protein